MTVVTKEINSRISFDNCVVIKGSHRLIMEIGRLSLTSSTALENGFQKKF